MDLLLHALAAPRRREILRLLRRRERSAGEIHRALGGVTFGAVSQHLGLLEQAGLVSARRAGRCRFYAARQEGLKPLRDWLDRMWSTALERLREQAEAEETGQRHGQAGVLVPRRRAARRVPARARSRRRTR